LMLNDSMITTTSRQTSTLEYQRTYYWRVSAINSAGSSAYSAAYRFTTKDTVPSVPILSKPVNGAQLSWSSPRLSWLPCVTAVTYHLQVSQDSLFRTFLINDSVLVDTSKLIGPLANQTKYFWRVRSKNLSGSSAYSAVYRFTTKIAVPPVPILSTPSNGTAGVTINPALTWNAVTGAAQYWLQLSNDSLFSKLIVNDSAITTTDRRISGLSTQMKYYWKVSAKNSSGTGPWSATWNFTTTIAVPDVPTLLVPLDRVVDVALNPVLTWNPVENASTYSVQVSVDSLFASTVVNDSLVSSASIQLASLLGNTTYYWHVKAKNDIGTSQYSSVVRFTTEGQIFVDKGRGIMAPNRCRYSVSVKQHRSLP
jgi:hypothetical protein